MGQAGARRGRWSCRELLPAWGGDCCGHSWKPQPTAAASSPAQARHSHAAGEKKTGGQRVKPAWPPGGGQWPELRLWPPGSKSCSASPRKAPGVTVAPALRSPAWPAHWPHQPLGRCGCFPRPAVCAAGHSWFSPVVTRARPGARRTGVHTWVHSPAGPLGPHTPPGHPVSPSER